jgi:hypothetical protein
MQIHPSTSVIDVNHYLKSWVSDLEHNIWKNLIDLINDARENNPYLSYQKDSIRYNYSLMWQEQYGINFPMMYVASVHLYLYAMSKGCDTFLFATRDCCHWVKIFKKLFPDVNAHYFHCSRNMLQRAADERNPHYKKYVQSLIKTTPDKCVYIDIHGTCQRVFTYFEKEFKTVPYCFLLSSSYRAYHEFPKICQKYHKEGRLINIVFDARGTPIEMLNFETIGTIQNYTNKGPVRDPPEYTTGWLEPYHICIGYMVSRMRPWSEVLPRELRHKTNIIGFDELTELVRRIYRVIQDNKPILNAYIKHPGKH